MPSRIKSEDVEDILPLTTLQEGMLLNYLKGRTREYSEQLRLDLSGDLSRSAFEGAWRRLLEEQEMLRVVFRWEEVKEPVQIILRPRAVNNLPAFYDLSGEPDAQSGVQQFLVTERGAGWDLRESAIRGYLLHLARDRHVFVLSNHHIIYDGWSGSVVLRRLFAHYSGLVNGTPVPQLSAPSFKRHIEEIKKDLSSEAVDFWRVHLANREGSEGLPPDMRHPENDEKPEIAVCLLPDFYSRLVELAKHHKVTLSTVVYAAWAMVLRKQTSQDDITMGTTVSGRRARADLEHAVGLYINTIPLRIRFDVDETPASLLTKVFENLQQRGAYENSPLPAIREIAGSPLPLFDSAVIVDNYPLGNLDELSASGLNPESYEFYERDGFNFSLCVLPGKICEIRVSWNPSLYDGAHGGSLINRTIAALGEMSERSHERVCDFSLLFSHEEVALSLDCGRRQVRPLSHRTVEEWIRETMTVHRDQTALVFGDAAMSYAELDAFSDAVAWSLHSRDIGEGDFVLMAFDPGMAMIVALLGVMKSGAAYIPVRPGAPTSVIEHIQSDSGARLLLTDGSAAPCRTPRWKIDLSKLKGGELFSPNSRICADSIVYCLYTSGSTGVPNGVLIEHRSIVNLLDWYGESYELSPVTRTVLLTDMSFDPSVEDILGTLVFGGTLFIPERDLRFDAEALREFIERSGATLLNGFTGYIRELLARRPKLDSVAGVIVGGEALDVSLRDELIELGYSVFNHYGLTETAVDTHVAECRAGEPIVLGNPIPNVTSFVLDRHGGIVPPYAVGEICVGGACLMRGYLNRPDLNERKFIVHPFDSSQMLLRTGDSGYWDDNGQIRLVGRMDDQLKVAGQRVNLGEIESLLRAMAGIFDATVLSVSSVSNVQILVAFVVAEGPLDATDLKRHLRANSPTQVVPGEFLFLPSLPRVEGGKADRRKLLSLYAELRADRQPRQEARNETEQFLLNTWQTLLKNEAVGLDDDFFEIGGNSLLLIRLYGSINRRFPGAVSVQDLFDNRTIEELAGLISDPAGQNQSEPAGFNEIAF